MSRTRKNILKERLVKEFRTYSKILLKSKKPEHKDKIGDLTKISWQLLDTFLLKWLQRCLLRSNEENMKFRG
jgi:hypothetical protein